MAGSTLCGTPETVQSPSLVPSTTHKFITLGVLYMVQHLNQVLNTSCVLIGMLEFISVKYTA